MIAKSVSDGSSISIRVGSFAFTAVGLPAKLSTMAFVVLVALVTHRFW